MFLVDTNVLVYAALETVPQHRRAQARLDRWRSGKEPWMAAWPIFYEFLRVTTHAAASERPLSLTQGWSFLRAVATSASFNLIEETARHAEVVDDLVRRFPGVRGNPIHDLHIVALMVEHGIREIRTTDAGFQRFGFLQVVNPLLPPGR